MVMTPNAALKHLSSGKGNIIGALRENFKLDSAKKHHLTKPESNLTTMEESYNISTQAPVFMSLSIA